MPTHECRCLSLALPGLLTKTSMRNSSSTSPSSSLSSPSAAASCSTPGVHTGLGWDGVRDKALVLVLLGQDLGQGSDLGLGWDKDKAQTLLLCTPLPRVTDAAFNFLLVWYYCTLTIRESILINNGSRCACAVGWVMAHRDFVSGGAALLHRGNRHSLLGSKAGGCSIITCPRSFRESC